MLLHETLAYFSAPLINLHMSMSIGSVAPISQGTPPSPVRARSDPRPNHKVSFKLTRPKASKAKYLTSSELSGIGMSIILSLVIALTIVLAGMYIGPIVLTFVTDQIREFVLASRNAHRQHQPNNIDSPPPVHKITRVLTLDSTVNCSYFASSIAGKNAVMFPLQNFPPHLADQLYSEFPEYLVQVQSIDTIENAYNIKVPDTPVLSMMLQKYRDFEWSLNPELGHTNHYVTENTILSSNPAFSALLPSPVLPGSVETNAACTLRNPPFGDFVAQSVSFGKNTSNLSGRGFHVHRRSLSVLLSGRKRWAIYPPHQVPSDGFNPLENLHDWREQVLPKLTSSDLAPYEVIQEAGQVVYVPEGWYHATQTLSAESVSVRFTPADEESGKYYYYLARGDQKIAAGDPTAAVKLYRLGLALQKDAILLMHLGHALEQLGLFVEAEEAYKDALRRSPRNPYVYTMLINLFVSHSAKDASTGIAELLERAEEFGLKSTVLELMKDVF